MYSLYSYRFWVEMIAWIIKVVVSQAFKITSSIKGKPSAQFIIPQKTDIQTTSSIMAIVQNWSLENTINLIEIVTWYKTSWVILTKEFFIAKQR